MEKKTRPGEKGFTVLLLLAGIYITIESWKMYQNAPELQGYGTVPLICGILLTVLTLANIFENFRVRSEIAGRPVKEQLVAIVRHLFSRDVVVMILFIAAYCFLISLRFMFEAATLIFLWGSMMFFNHREGKRSIVKNLIYSLLILAFVILVFHVGFRVVFP